MSRKKLKVKVLIGIPASGKSTWADSFVRNNPDWIRVCRDDMRKMLSAEYVVDFKTEDLISSMMDEMIIRALMHKKNVIIDNTNLRMKYIKHFEELVQYHADIEYQVFDISLKEALLRNSLRDRKVPENVMEKMFKDFKGLMDTFPENKSRKERPNFVPTPLVDGLQTISIFDIDGNLALMGRRGPFDWDRVDVDDLNEVVAKQIELQRSLGHKIFLLSGRDEQARQKTVEWLDFYNIKYDALLMRKKEDFRKDSIVKKEIYENELKGKYNIHAVWDDRLQVVKMWNEIGIFCFCTNQGLIEF